MKYFQTRMLIYEEFFHMSLYLPQLNQSSFDIQDPIQNYLTKTNTNNQLHYYVQLEIYVRLLIRLLQTRFFLRHYQLLFHFQ